MKTPLFAAVLVFTLTPTVNAQLSTHTLDDVKVEPYGMYFKMTITGKITLLQGHSFAGLQATVNYGMSGLACYISYSEQPVGGKTVSYTAWQLTTQQGNWLAKTSFAYGDDQKKVLTENKEKAFKVPQE